VVTKYPRKVGFIDYDFLKTAFGMDLDPIASEKQESIAHDP